MSAAARRSLRRLGTPRGAASALVAAGLLGIAVVNWTPPPTTPVPDPPARDLAAWSMPLDGVVGVSMEAVDEAEDIRLRPCLAAEGLTVTPPSRDPAALLAADAWGDGRDVAPPLDDARAAASGHAPVVDPAEAAHRAWALENNGDAALGRALETCLPGVRTGAWAHASTNQGVQQRARDLRVVARRHALADPRVATAAAAWRACLAGPAAASEAYANRPLPADPMTLLEPAGALGAGPAGTAGSAVPDAALAASDVACQRDSGYRQALYDAQWDAESLVSEDDAALFSSVRGRQVGETAAAVREVLLGDDR
jgi:hypothetical protein